MCKLHHEKARRHARDRPELLCVSTSNSCCPSRRGKGRNGQGQHPFTAQAPSRHPCPPYKPSPNNCRKREENRGVRRKKRLFLRLTPLFSCFPEPDRICS